MISSGMTDYGCILSVSYDQRTINPSDFKKYPFMRMTPQPKYSNIPPMYAMRREIHKMGVKLPYLLLDDDDYFTPESTRYLIDCAMYINGLEEESGYQFFLGTDSFFGSNHHKDRIHISPVNALMPKGKGLMFTSGIDLSGSFFEQYEWCLGGLEEHLLCAIATKFFDAIPLKRFQNPTKCTLRKTEDRYTSPIHNHDVWKGNSMTIIRSLSGEANWQYPINMYSKGTKAPKVWMHRAEKFKEEFGI
jgi:hypothetical protein